MEYKKLQNKIRLLIIFFIAALALSGITAFPIQTELQYLVDHKNLYPGFMEPWIQEVYSGIKNTYAQYPFVGYGTDWLAFAHLVIAINFIGPLKDPVKNIWVIQFGMLACALIIPLAMIAGEIRHIPIYWRVLDCAFGVFGIIPLYMCYKLIKKLENIPQILSK